MRYINILLGQARHLSVEKNRLRIVSATGEEFFYPLEDVNAVLLESHKMTISVYTLNKFAENGIACYVCGENHLPNGIILPFNSFFQKPKIMQLQQELAKPLQKRLWQAIIKRKILNQSRCLKLSEKLGWKELEALADNVQSGDVLNVEAIAARKFFGFMFGKNFSRKNEDFENAALNYGYSILRGAIARTLALHGFEPSIGINHCNNYNAFNLADDLIEPFRPIVDLLVGILEKSACLTTMHKQQLLGVLQLSCMVKNEKCSVEFAIEKLVCGFKESLEKKELCLALPSLIELEVQKYE